MRLYRAFTSQEALDREYNVAAACADAEARMAGWQARSARVLDQIEVRRGLRYGPTRAEHLDFFPAGDGAPLHIFIHGGYWRRFAAADFAFLAPAITEAGIALANVNYALCPEVSISEIVRQIRAAVAWCHRHAGELAVDRERITVSGHSAGGHLVAMALATDWPGVYDLPADILAGGLAISGLFDLAPLRFTYLQPALQLDGDEIERSSPIRHIPRAAPSLTVAVGGAETAEFRRQSREFHAAWRAAGLEGHWLEPPGLDHFAVLEELERPDSELFGALVGLARGE